MGSSQRVSGRVEIPKYGYVIKWIAPQNPLGRGALSHELRPIKLVGHWVKMGQIQISHIKPTNIISFGSPIEFTESFEISFRPCLDLWKFDEKCEGKKIVKKNKKENWRKIKINLKSINYFCMFF